MRRHVTSSCYCFPVLPPERSRDPFLESPDNQRARKAVVVYVQDKDRLFTVPYFFVRSFRYTASYRHGYLDFQMYRALGIVAWGGGEKNRKKYFSRFLPNRPRPLSSFDTHARWQPVTQSARSRRSYGKTEDCQQSKIKISIIASNMIKPSVNETKWSSLLARTRALILFISIWIFNIGPEKLPRLSRNGPRKSVSRKSRCNYQGPVPRKFR